MSDFTFSTLEYQRPDFAAVGSFAEQMAERMKQAGSYEELKALMKENEEASKDFTTMCVIASIRNTLTRETSFTKRSRSTSTSRCLCSHRSFLRLMRRF